MSKWVLQGQFVDFDVRAEIKSDLQDLISERVLIGLYPFLEEKGLLAKYPGGATMILHFVPEDKLTPTQVTSITRKAPQ